MRFIIKCVNEKIGTRIERIGPINTDFLNFALSVFCPLNQFNQR
jgi:hypothetical protein